MKISLAQTDLIIGDFNGNFQKIKACIEEARLQKSDLVCFSELTTCGYPPKDLLEFDSFIQQSNNLIENLLPESQDIGILIGAPLPNNNSYGKPLFNAALLLHEGKIKDIRYKSLLPTYDVFDEYRYFEPANQWDIIPFKNKKIALTICEDLWNIGSDKPLYQVVPMDQLMLHKPDLMINLSASPFSVHHGHTRLEVMKKNAAHYQLPLFYVNQVGAHTDLIFDGGSAVFTPHGAIYDAFPMFENAVKSYDLQTVIQAEITNEPEEKTPELLLHDGLIFGLKSFFEKLGFKKAIIGLSGGIDSAITAYLGAKALGAENVLGILMPSKFSSQHSIDDAIQLAHNLNINYHIIPIHDVVETFDTSLKPLFQDMPFSLAEENIQSRSRGNLLMAISNKLGYILLNTSNKSEMAVGYGTLYGDMCGALSVLGDVYKSDIYRLAHYINRQKEIIPKNTIEKEPSAELRPNQKDEDSLPPYTQLDAILYQYIEEKKGTKEIQIPPSYAHWIDKIIHLVNANEFKRHQTPPVLRISQKAFGSGRRMPIVGKFFL
jgi:NAD+ synthase (glutamine-hydrolysing)